jgi:hypothetical protein
MQALTVNVKLHSCGTPAISADEIDQEEQFPFYLH